MKRLAILTVVMGLFYITMVGFSSAEQKPKVDVQNKNAQLNPPHSKDTDYSDLDRDDLKEGLTRAFYDVLMSAKNDIDNADNAELRDQEALFGKDDDRRAVFQEARRTIFEADQILSRVKAENRVALEKLRHPPQRVLPRQQRLLPKENGVRNDANIKQQVEAQKKRVAQEQLKLQQLQKTLETQTAEK
ncbi:MAG: hypothetical protein NXI29_04840 [bacterium]|uniref:Uncharacterized protein n=1 Tax=Gimesia chilikensis TaxID=2605989 RepID=A0A517PMI4_9PLAN|nr:hypothetical protein [Gimesia chilikensis]MCR9230319.1 hypothetical protein [bacterium]QDT20574.1 hypothetical protein HG66A1_23620 [Gimesia chilikensis]